MLAYALDSDEQNRSIVSWSSIAVLLDNVIARAVYVVPVAGYVILYSDFFQGLFRYSILPSNGFLTFLQRVSFAYYGSIMLLVAFVFYRIFAPRLLRNRRDIQHFVSDIINAQDSATLHYILGMIDSYLKPYEQELGMKQPDHLADIQTRRLRDLLGQALSRGHHPDPTLHNAASILHFYYNWQNKTHETWRIAIFSLAIAGYGLLALPALDLFWRVIITTALHLF